MILRNDVKCEMINVRDPQPNIHVIPGLNLSPVLCSAESVTQNTDNSL